MKNEKGEEKGPKRGGLGQLSLINEIIKREKRFNSIYTTFTLNVDRLNMVTDKPTNYKRVDIAKKSAEIPDYIKDKIKYHFKTPSEKYVSPMTSSQEFGWDRSDYLNLYMKKHPKISCDVTRYADEYQSLKGQNPFSSKIGAPAAK